MKVHELIHLLKQMPIGMDVYILTNKHEPLTFCDVHHHKTHGHPIIQLSTLKTWRAKVTPPCSSPPTPTS